MSRDYSKVRPEFWTRGTGKGLRGDLEAQVVAMYLITGPASHMTGLFYLPAPTLSHETGIPLEGALKALRSLSEGGFSRYDEESEHVFIPEMARFQIGENLSQRDNRHKALVRELDGLRKSPFFNDFIEKYGEPYELKGLFAVQPLLRGLEAPSNPLVSGFLGRRDPIAVSHRAIIG